MTVSITTTPEFPAPGRPLQMTLTTNTGNFVRLFAVFAPQGSTLRAKLDAAGPGTREDLPDNPGTFILNDRRRIHVASIDSGRPFPLTFEVGGLYTFACQEVTKGASSHGGGYQGDPAGHASETILSETPLELYVGQRLTMPIDAAGDSCTLVLWVWEDTIRATTATTHGETSPALIDPAGPRAASAIETATVRAALAALTPASPNPPLTAADALGDLDAIFADIVTTFNDHLLEAGVHNDLDIDNEIAAGAASGATDDTISETLASFRRHYNNDANDIGSDPPEYGNGSKPIHEPGTDQVWDRLNAPIIPSASGLSQRLVAIADLHRSYEAHRQSEDHHDTADETNTLAPLPEIPALVSAYLAQIASTAAAAPEDGQTVGAQALLTIGFQEAPLAAD